MTLLNCLHKIGCSVIDTWQNVCKTLSIGSPLNYYFVEAICGLEVTVPDVSDRLDVFLDWVIPDILSEMFNMVEARFASLD